MSSATTTKTLSITPIYGKLRYVTATWAPKPISQPFGLPDISDYEDERLMPIHDIRPLPTVDELPTAKEGTAQLLTHGFTAVKHPSSLHSSPYNTASWRDPELVQRVYVAEVEDMLERITGAKTIITEVLLMRGAPKSVPDHPNPATHTRHEPDHPNKQTPTQVPGKPLPTHLQDRTIFKLPFPNVVGFSPVFGGVPPAPKTHLDFTPSGARTHIRLFHPTLTAACARIIAAEDRLHAADLPLATHYASAPDAPRWAIYSVWRPLKPVKRDPLAVCDVRSFAREDYVPIEVPAPTIGEDGENKGMHAMQAYVARGSEAHRWCYVSEQVPEEVLVLGLWDSDREGDSVSAGGAVHSSVELEGREAEEPRESLEVRCVVIW
ncbi:hypothetical protein MMC34_002565 [Xylographa carneopallida]|nr:hypothetical protein [Xylographa carneopallida]